MDILSYSVMSPDMAISGVGVALASVLAIISIGVSIDPKQRLTVLGMGVFLLAYAVYRVFMDFSNDGIPESGVGAFGIWWLTFTASWTFGTVLTIAALASWLTESPVRDRRSRSARRANRQRYPNWIHECGRIAGFAALRAGAGMTITLMLGITLIQATLVGRMDASVKLRDAPLVEITSKSQTVSDLLTGYEISSGKGKVGNSFKMVHVGSKFVYVRRPEFSCVCPEDVGLKSGDPYQYAIPVSEIASITQIAEPQ